MRVLEVGGQVFLLRFLPDGRRLLVGTLRAEPRMCVAFAVWPPAGGRPVRLRLSESDAWGFGFAGNSVAIHPDGETCYLIRHRRLLAFRTASGRAQPAPAGIKGPGVILSPAGDRLVAVDWRDGVLPPSPVRLIAATTGPRRGRVVWRGTLADEPNRFPYLAGFLPDGDRFVIIDDAVRVHSFETRRVQVLARFRGIQVTDRRISPDGRELGVVGHSTMYFYDLTAAGEPRRIGGTRSVGDGGFAYHPSGKTVAVLHGAATQVKVYDRATLEVVHTWDWKLGALQCVAFSPDGTLGAAGSLDGRVVVWDVDE